jgi:hypothetical protein
VANAARTETRDLFQHELRHDGKLIALLRGVPGEAGTVTVETEVRPVSLVGREPLCQPFPFASREQASRFAEAALDALQYLGCTLVE